MRLGQRSETFAAPEDHSWLGSAHASDTWESITLDGPDFAATFTDGFIPSGVVVSEQANGLFTLGHGGDAVPARVGHLATTKAYDVGEALVVGALMWHGQVIVDRLPVGHGLVAAGAALMPQIDYVGEVAA